MVCLGDWHSSTADESHMLGRVQLGGKSLLRFKLILSSLPMAAVMLAANPSPACACTNHKQDTMYMLKGPTFICISQENLVLGWNNSTAMAGGS